MMRPLRAALPALLAGILCLPAAEAQQRGPRTPLPSAAEVMRKARAQTGQRHEQFSGRLRTSSSRAKVVVPFILTMDGRTMVYEFTEGPPEALILTLGQNSSRLERATGRGKARAVSASKLDEAVRGTDITYEDLALKFLYWKRARVIKEDIAMTRSCWVVETFPDRPGESQYDRVLLWIEKSGALLKAECYSGGKRMARFEVRKVQKAAQGGYVLRSMTVSRIDPATGRDRNPTYLELTPVRGE